jgi:hypothetical protein
MMPFGTRVVTYERGHPSPPIVPAADTGLTGLLHLSPPPVRKDRKMASPKRKSPTRTDSQALGPWRGRSENQCCPPGGRSSTHPIALPLVCILVHSRAFRDTLRSVLHLRVALGYGAFVPIEPTRKEVPVGALVTVRRKWKGLGVSHEIIGGCSKE